MLSVGIITAPRDQASYLASTLESYFQCWDVKPFIFAEPGSVQGVQYGSHCEWKLNEETLGIVGNWINAAKFLLEETNDEYLMICEDDIHWHEKASILIRRCMLSGRVLDWKFRDLGFLSPYCSQMNAFELAIAENHWHRCRMPSFFWCGNLALVFHRESLEEVLSHEEKLRTYTHTKEQKEVHLDYALGKMFHELDRPIIAHMPTLVKHIGEVSTSVENNCIAGRTLKSRLPAL